MIYRSLPIESKQWTLTMDLKADLHSLMAVDMRKRGVAPSGQRDIGYQYFNLMKRLVSVRPRNIIKSKEFFCPPEYALALEDFEKAIKEGKNLNWYLSDSIRNPSAPDDLLNDWNIVHFHLSRRFRADGFVKRSNYQVFAWIADDCAYLIQIYSHRADNLYCRQEMIRIIENNWPQLLEPYKLKDVVRLSETFDDEAYSKIRKAHATSFVQTGENKVYGLIGGGYMSDGSSGEAMRNADFWYRHLKFCESRIKLCMPTIVQAVQSMRTEAVSEYEIKLACLPENSNEIKVMEIHNFVGIQMLLEEGRFRIYRIEDEVEWLVKSV